MPVGSGTSAQGHCRAIGGELGKGVKSRHRFRRGQSTAFAPARTVRSLLSLLSYLGSGEYREKYLGIKIPPTNLQDHHLQEARKFADGLASRVASTRETQ